jgi:hypothetical protein
VVGIGWNLMVIKQLAAATNKKRESEGAKAQRYLGCLDV